MKYFDFETCARKIGLSEQSLQELCKLVRREYPSDDMMYELHVLRACQAIRDGLVSLEEILASETAART